MFVSHFICKWLDKYDGEPQSLKRKAPLELQLRGGFSIGGESAMDYLYTFCFYYMRFSAKVKRCTESLQS